MDHDGEVFEAFVSTTPDKKAAPNFLMEHVKRYGRAEELMTDRLKSCGAAVKGGGVAGHRRAGRRVN